MNTPAPHTENIPTYAHELDEKLNAFHQQTLSYLQELEGDIATMKDLLHEFDLRLRSLRNEG